VAAVVALQIVKVDDHVIRTTHDAVATLARGASILTGVMIMIGLFHFVVCENLFASVAVRGLLMSFMIGMCEFDGESFEVEHPLSSLYQTDNDVHESIVAFVNHKGFTRSVVALARNRKKARRDDLVLIAVFFCHSLQICIGNKGMSMEVSVGLELHAAGVRKLYKVGHARLQTIDG
jgi:hypothetical protein